MIDVKGDDEMNETRNKNIDNAIGTLTGLYAWDQVRNGAIDMAIQALKTIKEQGEGAVEPKPIELAQGTKDWLDAMSPAEALGNIADICMDWDGYRTRDGLGSLINEIWAYARYCAKKFAE